MTHYIFIKVPLTSDESQNFNSATVLEEGVYDYFPADHCKRLANMYHGYAIYITRPLHYTIAKQETVFTEIKIS